MNPDPDLAVTYSHSLISISDRRDEALHITRHRYDDAATLVPVLISAGDVGDAAVPALVADGYEYRLPSESVNGLHVTSSDSACRAAEAVCSVLVTLHNATSRLSGSDISRLGPPPWVQRLDKYLTKARVDPTFLSRELRAEIPDRYLSTPILPPHQGPACLLHGAPSLATTYLAGEQRFVLTTEDVSIGPPELDWAFFLGELAELELFDSFTTACYTDAISEVVEPNLVGLDHSLIDGMVQHRRMLHVLDYIASFVNVHHQVPQAVFTILRTIQWESTFR
ncbi:hypothetical protein [Nocardia fluminea]|uniref:hypothetical protein n=1 Tax=Nocardia fluminea TaxID=134984 RepID=UPI0033CA5349